MSLNASILLPALLATAIPSSYANELIVHVDRIENSCGFICIAVDRAESGYLASNGAKAFRREKVPARTSGVTIDFHDLPPGKYAIKVFLDENSDGELNRNFFGAPTEPYGISNNVRARFSLPAFSDALVGVGKGTTETRIILGNH